MKILLSAFFLLQSAHLTATTTDFKKGESIQGPPTMEHPTYPTSGLLKSRGQNLGGSGVGSRPMGDTQSGNGPMLPQSQEEDEFQTGPYKDGEYQIQLER